MSGNSERCGFTYNLLLHGASNAKSLDQKLMRVSGRVWTPHPDSGEGVET